jgi:hypothetical protein
MILKTKKDHTLELSHYVESSLYSSQNGLILYLAQLFHSINIYFLRYFEFSGKPAGFGLD